MILQENTTSDQVRLLVLMYEVRLFIDISKSIAITFNNLPA